MESAQEKIDLNKELSAVYEKHLPKIVGESLRKRLELADELEQRNQIQKEEIERLRKQKGNLEEIIEQHKSLTERENVVQIREEASNKKEVEQKINELTYQLEAANGNTKFAQDVAMGLVRNTSYRKNIFDSEFVPGQGYSDSNGTYHPIPPVNTSKNHTETKHKD